jgi:hypothetical protein
MILAGCAATQGRLSNASTAELVALLQTGRPVLDCREPCLAEWRRVQPQAAQLEASGRWADLAVLVMRTGYQDDLSLYYLGRAAEGLGYRAAAQSFYRQSMQLSGTSIACEHLSGQCGGVVLPTAASRRIAAIDLILSPPPVPRRSPRAPRQNGIAPVAAPAPAVAPEEPAAAIPVEALSPPPPAAVPPPVYSPRRPAPKAPIDYIEPPAVPR